MEMLGIERQRFWITAFGCGFTVQGKPVPGGSKSIMRPPNLQGRTVVVDSNQKAVKPWRQEIQIIAGTLMKSRQLFEGPLVISVDFYQLRPKWHTGKRGVKPTAPKFPTGAPDATKLLRPVEDALTGILWKDDAQVVEQHVRKLYGDPARMEFRMAVKL